MMWKENEREKENKMKTFKIIMNVFGIIGASILSIFLVLALAATSFVYAASSFFQGENIFKIIASVDYSAIISSEMDEIDGEIVNELMQSEMMEEIVDLCVENIFDAIEENDINRTVSSDDVEDIMEEHEDDIKKMVEEYVGDTIPLTEEILDEMTDALIQEYSIEIAESLPTVYDLGLDKDTLNIIMNLKNGTYFKTALAIAVVLTILVMLCQVMRFKGFMWIGVNYLVASVLTLISSAVIKTINLGELLDVDALAYPVLNTITGIIASDIVKGVIIMAVSGVVFIVVFIVGRKLLKNKK